MLKTPAKRENRRLTHEVIVAAAVLSLTAISLLILVAAGNAGRQYGVAARPRVYYLNRESDAFAIWKSFNFRGRTVLHFGRHMPMRSLREDTVGKLLALQRGSFEEMLELSHSEMTESSYLYAASRANIIRKVYGVIPDQDFKRVKRGAAEEKVYRVEENYISGWVDGLPFVSARQADLPRLNEPVMLNFAADYFDEQKIDPERIVQTLRRKNIKYDVITITPPRADPKFNDLKKDADKLRDLLEAAE